MWKTIATLIFIGSGTSSDALTPLHENPVVVKGLYALGLADEVRKNCDSISPRFLRAYNYLKSLERYARDLGYSEDQIDELVDNKVEKEKLRVQMNGRNFLLFTRTVTCGSFHILQKAERRCVLVVPSSLGLLLQLRGHTWISRR